MASQPSPATAQPPPDLPNMPEVSTTLSNYLRVFSLWCRNGFAEQMRNNEANPGVLVRAYDTASGVNPNIFMIEVNSAGVIRARQVGLGGGNV